MVLSTVHTPFQTLHGIFYIAYIYCYKRGQPHDIHRRQNLSANLSHRASIIYSRKGIIYDPADL